MSLLNYIDRGTNIEGTEIQPTYDNPYPTGTHPYTIQSGTKYAIEPGSTSAPAAAQGASSGGLSSIPTMDKIPEAKDVMGMLKLRSMM